MVRAVRGILRDFAPKSESDQVPIASNIPKIDGEEDNQQGDGSDMPPPPHIMSQM